MMVFDSQMIVSPSSTVGTSPFGFILRYAGSLVLPKLPPASMRSNLMPISSQVHSTFCTFDELARPQIFSIAFLPEDSSPGHRRAIYRREQPRCGCVRHHRVEEGP